PTSNLRSDGTVVVGWGEAIRMISPDLTVQWRIPPYTGTVPPFTDAAYDDVVFAGDYAAVQQTRGYPYRGLVGIDATGHERWVARIPDAAGPYARVSTLTVGRDGMIYLIGSNAV